MTCPPQHFVSGVTPLGQFFTVPAPLANYAIGDDRFWPRGLTEEWALRPVLFSDLPSELWVQPGLWMLARCFEDVSLCFRALAIVAAALRANTPLSILRLIGLMSQRKSAFGNHVLEIQALAAWARSQSPQPIYEHRDVIFLDNGVVSGRQDIIEEARQ